MYKGVDQDGEKVLLIQTTNYAQVMLSLLGESQALKGSQFYLVLIALKKTRLKIKESSNLS